MQDCKQQRRIELGFVVPQNDAVENLGSRGGG